MTDSAINALLEAHEAIIVEREDAKHEFSDTSELFPEGHLNGLNEARNRIEELIEDRCSVTESDIAEYYQEQVEARRGGESHD